MDINFSTKAPHIVKSAFKMINNLSSVFSNIANIIWTYPTEISEYKQIPIIGNFSIFILIIIFASLVLTIRFSFVQIRYFKKSIHTYNRGMSKGSGHYSSSFLLALAARIGSKNIVGVASCIALGGPGAMFWIWVCGIFSMGLAFIEGALTQIFKGKKESIYYGGLPFYGQKLCNNNKFVGAFLAIAYILYAFCSIPLQGNMAINAFGKTSEILLNTTLPFQAYNFLCISLVLMVGLMVFGSIHRIKRACNIIVPFMLLLYALLFVFLFIYNFDKIPYVFLSIFKNAFNSKAFITGNIGYMISIGAKTAISSNEAGMGTITFADATSNCSNPIRQGLMSSLNVFIDTIIICSMTGYIIIAGKCYSDINLQTQFFNATDIDKFSLSLYKLSPTQLVNTVNWIAYLCLGLFAFTTLICQIGFCDLAIMKITRKKAIRYIICGIALFITAFGVISNLMGLELNNLWELSNLATAIMALINIPLLFVGTKYVALSLKFYKRKDHNIVKFTSKNIGSDIPFKYWDRNEELNDND